MKNSIPKKCIRMKHWHQLSPFSQFFLLSFFSSLNFFLFLSLSSFRNFRHQNYLYPCLISSIFLPLYFFLSLSFSSSLFFSFSFSFLSLPFFPSFQALGSKNLNWSARKEGMIALILEKRKELERIRVHRESLERQESDQNDLIASLNARVKGSSYAWILFLSVFSFFFFHFLSVFFFLSLFNLSLLTSQKVQVFKNSFINIIWSGQIKKFIFET